MSTIFLSEVNQTAIELNKLRDLNIHPDQIASWRQKSRNSRSLIKLIKQVGVIDETPDKQDLIVLSPVNVCEHGCDDIKDITDYFTKFVIKSFDNFGLEVSQDDELPDIIAFNFMPFIFRPANANRIIRGICQGLTVWPQLSKSCLVFFVRQHTLFSRSEQLCGLIQSNDGPNKAVIIDLDGYAVIIARNTEDIQAEPITSKTNISRMLFEEILHFKDKTSFRNALIYETNINIGHFDVGTCHVRTHYDLKDFIRRDNVFEHLYNEFYNITDKYNRTSIIAIGLEDEALTIFGNRIEAANKNDPQVKTSKKKQLREVFWRGHFLPDEILNQKKSIKKWAKNSDCLFLLTDVVNSGATIFKLKAKLEEIIKDTKKSRDKDNAILETEIKLFSVVKMNNAPDDIPSAVVINRPYHSSKPALCPLCILGQPIKRIDPNNWKTDFRYVAHNQLTPLDFWEIVQDCRAFKRKMPYLAGGKLIHRVDTSKIIQRYKNWLSNIVQFKYLSTWGVNFPDRIITLKGEPGEEYAKLILNALKKPKIDILSIPRDVINEEEQLPNNLENQLIDIKNNKKEILLVDDGINSGGTAKKLIKFANKYEIKIMGFLVLDNRLNEKQSQELELSMNSGKLICLYNWPSYPV